MGGICSCLDSNKQDSYRAPSSRTPLLSSIPSSSDNGSSNNPARSVRQQRIDKERVFLTSLQQLSPVIIDDLPIAILDKTFKDHARLYNDLLEKFEVLQQILNDFKALYENDKGMPSLKECMKLMSEYCGDAKITAKRTKHSVQLKYDVRNVSECCKCLPEDALEGLALYNKANTLIRTIMEKSPHVKDSIQLVLDDEDKLRRDVTKEDLSPADGPEAIKGCARNINSLRTVPGALDTIKKYTDKSFQDIVESSKQFFNDRNIQGN